MKSLIISVVPVFAPVLLSVPALADVTPLTQSRLVHAHLGAADPTVSAPDFGPFSASVGEITFQFGSNGAIATQNSTIAPDRFDYAGSVHAYRSFSFAESNYQVGFRVVSPQTFVFDAEVHGGDAFGSGSLSSVLTGPAGEVFSGNAFDIPPNFHVTTYATGLLAPGDYTLSIAYSVHGLSTSVTIGSDGTAVMTLAAVPHCADDFNNDGTVNSQDFFAFLEAFFAASPSADLNNDGVVNSQDFFDFIAVFFNGC
jgi:hypothetical protein